MRSPGGDFTKHQQAVGLMGATLESAHHHMNSVTSSQAVHVCTVISNAWVDMDPLSKHQRITHIGKFYQMQAIHVRVNRSAVNLCSLYIYYRLFGHKIFKHCLNKMYPEGQDMSPVKGFIKIIFLYSLYLPLYIYIYHYSVNFLSVTHQGNEHPVYSDTMSEKQGVTPSPLSEGGLLT